MYVNIRLFSALVTGCIMEKRLISLSLWAIDQPHEYAPQEVITENFIYADYA